MSADKYPYIFSRQIEAIVYTFACIFVEQKSLSRRKCLKHFLNIFGKFSSPITSLPNACKILSPVFKHEVSK